MTIGLLKELTDQTKLKLIAAIAADYGTDENEGDWTERAETIMWVASNGEEGKDWGLTYKLMELGGGK